MDQDNMVGELRIRALGLAIDFSRGQTDCQHCVTAIAEAFYRFLLTGRRTDHDEDPETGTVH